MSGEAAPAGRTLIRVGGLLTMVGMLLTGVAVIPLFSGVALPGYFWGLAMITGVGMALVLLGLARNGRSRAALQRQA